MLGGVERPQRVLEAVDVVIDEPFFAEVLLPEERHEGEVTVLVIWCLVFRFEFVGVLGVVMVGVVGVFGMVIVCSGLGLGSWGCFFELWRS